MKKKLSLFVASIVGAFAFWNLYRFAYDKSFLWACILFSCTFMACFFTGLLLIKVLNPSFPYRVNLLLKLVSIIRAVPSVCIILRYLGVRVQLMLPIWQSLFLVIIAGVMWGLQQGVCSSKN
jgi:hypothetical protein